MRASPTLEQKHIVFKVYLEVHFNIIISEINEVLQKFIVKDIRA